MPKPVYIICARSVTVDRETNLVSISNVIEKVDVSVSLKKTPEGQSAVTNIQTTEAQIVAVWSKVPGDEGRQFEAQFTIQNPEGDVISAQITPFEFEKGKLLHRFILKLNVIPVHKSGFITITSNVRRKDTNTWQSQEYSIVVESHVHLDPLLKRLENAKHLLKKQD